MSDYKVNILHLYPDMLNLYGDKGNIECLKKRLLWRGIEAEITVCSEKDEHIDFENTDIIYAGGGSDREQAIVCLKLMKHKAEIKSFVENGKTLLAFCGGFEMMGNSFYNGDEKVEGLGVLDIDVVSHNAKERLIGNVVLKSDFIDGYIVGFENHGGKMNIKNYKPLGKVIAGHGNDGKSGFEGVIYKNFTGTYLHGPLLPKNPALCDFILLNTLKNKYPEFDKLSPLDDAFENMANKYIVQVYSQK